MKILFICTSNSSRSPMAEALFRHMIKGTVLEGNAVCLSSGLYNINGDDVSEYAVIALEEIDIDISEHKSRRLNPKDIPVWDVYFSMGDTHAYILEKAGIPHDKIYIPTQSIIDPYGLGLDGFRQCRDQLKEEILQFIEILCKHYENS